MASMYNISKNLLEIFDTIEECDGEITPEISKKLELTNEALKDKCDDYVNAITMIKGEIATIKDESKRLSELKKHKDNTIDKLRRSLLDAVVNFGTVTATGVNKIKTDLHSISLRAMLTLNINEDLINAVIERFVNRYTFKVYTKTIDEPETIKEIVDSCNTPIGSIDEDDKIYDTIDELDFKEIATKISFDFKLSDITTPEGKALIKALCRYTKNIQYEASINKEDLKRYVVAKKDSKLATIDYKNTVVIK